MITREAFMDIHSYHRQGFTHARAIARKLGIHRNTVTKYLADPTMPRYL